MPAALAAALLGIFPASAQDVQDDEPGISERFAELDEYEAARSYYLGHSQAEFLLQDVTAANGPDDPLALRLQCRMVRLAALESMTRGLDDQVEAAFASLPDTTSRTGVECLLARSLAHWRLGRLEAAQVDARQAVLTTATSMPGERELQAQALTQLAMILREQGRFDEARALDERSVAITGPVARPDFAVPHQSRLAILDDEIRLGRQLESRPALYELLGDIKQTYSFYQFRAADVLERIAYVEYFFNDTELAVRAIRLASALRSPDPVGLTSEEYALFLANEVMEARLQRERAERVVAGERSADAFLAWLGISFDFPVDHPDRIAANTRLLGEELAWQRYPEIIGLEHSPSLDPDFLHRRSREAMVGLIRRMALTDPERVLPVGFDPLGNLTPADVAFLHVDTLWEDANALGGQVR